VQKWLEGKSPKKIIYVKGKNGKRGYLICVQILKPDYAKDHFCCSAVGNFSLVTGTTTIKRNDV
jgi:hypothetical protein